MSGTPNAKPVQTGQPKSIVDSSHVYCPVCDAVEPLKVEASEVSADASEAMTAMDLVCATCDFVVATLYRAPAGLASEP